MHVANEFLISDQNIKYQYEKNEKIKFKIPFVNVGIYFFDGRARVHPVALMRWEMKTGRMGGGGGWGRGVTLVY